MKLKSLVNYCDKYLEIKEFKDFCPNGLQVEGRNEVERIVTGVTASEALIDKAIALNAQALVVHHGYFWKGESQAIVGIKGNRIRKLMQNNISLLAYHLPLDAHAIVGNNAQLGHLFGIQTMGSFYDVSGKDIALYGEVKNKLDIDVFNDQVSKLLGRSALLIKGSQRKVKTIAWCSGGAQNGFEQAIDMGADVYISGEASENTFHLAKESGVHYIGAGHHATERLGVKTFGEHLSKQFSIDVEFIDLYNPI